MPKTPTKTLRRWTRPELLGLDGQTQRELRRLIRLSARGDLGDDDLRAFYQASAVHAIRNEAFRADAVVTDGDFGPVLYHMRGETAIVPVYGVIEAHCSMFDELFGCLPVGRMIRAFDAVRTDERVARVITDTHSPGGDVNHCGDLLKSFRALCEAKPVIGFAHDLMGSMAYWLNAFAAEIAVTPTARVGAISVGFGTIYDDSRRFLEEGVEAIDTHDEGALKAMDDGLPVTDEQREMFRRLSAKANGMQLDQIAAQRGGRGLTRDAIIAMQGGVFMGEEATANGLADRVVEDLDELLGDDEPQRTNNPTVPSGRSSNGPSARAKGPDMADMVIKEDMTDEQAREEIKKHRPGVFEGMSEEEEEPKGEGAEDEKKKDEEEQPKGEGSGGEKKDEEEKMSAAASLGDLKAHVPQATPNRADFIIDCAEKGMSLLASMREAGRLIDLEAEKRQRDGDRNQALGSEGTDPVGSGGGGSIGGKTPIDQVIAEAPDYATAWKQVKQLEGCTDREAMKLVNQSPNGAKLREKLRRPA